MPILDDYEKHRSMGLLLCSRCQGSGIDGDKLINESRMGREVPTESAICESCMGIGWEKNSSHDDSDEEVADNR